MSITAEQIVTTLQQISQGLFYQELVISIDSKTNRSLDEYTRLTRLRYTKNNSESIDKLPIIDTSRTNAVSRVNNGNLSQFLSDFSEFVEGQTLTWKFSNACDFIPGLTQDEQDRIRTQCMSILDYLKRGRLPQFHDTWDRNGQYDIKVLQFDLAPPYLCRGSILLQRRDETVAYGLYLLPYFVWDDRTNNIVFNWDIADSAALRDGATPSLTNKKNYDCNEGTQFFIEDKGPTLKMILQRAKDLVDSALKVTSTIAWASNPALGAGIQVGQMLFDSTKMGSVQTSLNGMSTTLGDENSDPDVLNSKLIHAGIQSRISTITNLISACRTRTSNRFLHENNDIKRYGTSLSNYCTGDDTQLQNSIEDLFNEPFNSANCSFAVLGTQIQSLTWLFRLLLQMALVQENIDSPPITDSIDSGLIETDQNTLVSIINEYVQVFAPTSCCKLQDYLTSGIQYLISQLDMERHDNYENVVNKIDGKKAYYIVEKGIDNYHTCLDYLVNQSLGNLLWEYASTNSFISNANGISEGLISQWVNYAQNASYDQRSYPDERFNSMSFVWWNTLTSQVSFPDTTAGQAEKECWFEGNRVRYAVAFYNNLAFASNPQNVEIPVAKISSHTYYGPVIGSNTDVGPVGVFAYPTMTNWPLDPYHTATGRVMYRQFEFADSSRQKAGPCFMAILNLSGTKWSTTQYIEDSSIIWSLIDSDTTPFVDKAWP